MNAQIPNQPLGDETQGLVFKKIPHSIEAEQAVLGSLMISPYGWDRVASVVTATDFYLPDHALIFQTIADLNRRQQIFDVITVTHALKQANRLEQVGGQVYIATLSNQTPTAANIAAYAQIVREQSILRQLIQVSELIGSSAYETGGRAATDLLDQAEGLIFEVAERTSRGIAGPQLFDQVLSQTLLKLERLARDKRTIIGLPSGFVDLDRMTSGLHAGDLIIVAGRPSMGKTMFAMNIAEHAVLKENKPVLVFSMEMPADAIALRLLSSVTGIGLKRLRLGDLSEAEWPTLGEAVVQVGDKKLWVDETPALSPPELRARARRVAREQGQLGLIVVDYLQLMQVPGFRAENRVAEISEISRGLKTLAKELGVPVIALSQLNRSLEQRADRRPLMSDLRESGAIEQDADLIIFLYRDKVYNPNSPEGNQAEVIISKHRNGEIGKIKLLFQGECVRFRNLDFVQRPIVSIESNPESKSRSESDSGSKNPTPDTVSSAVTTQLVSTPSFEKPQEMSFIVKHHPDKNSG